MSNLMFYGVLRMPYEMAMENELSRRQFYDRAQEAANRVEAAERSIEELESRATSGAASGEAIIPVEQLWGPWDKIGTAPAEQSAPPLPRMDAELLAIAGVMSNTLFNMAQQTGHTLTSDDTALFDRLRKQWDSAASRGRAQGGITSEISDERILEIAAEQDYGDEDPKCILRLARALLANQSASTAHNCPIQTPYGPAECFECAPGSAAPQDIAALAWQSALNDAALYVANHCANGDHHAEIINEMPMPKLTFGTAPSAPGHAEPDFVCCEHYVTSTGSGLVCCGKPMSGAPGQADTERDAARYRWIKVNHTIGKALLGLESHPRYASVVRFPVVEGETLDSAIDSAIAALSKENA